MIKHITMKTIYITCLIGLAGCLYSCIPAKGMDNKENATTNLTAKKEMNQEVTEKEMIDKGYSKGTLVASKSSSCPYILTVDTYPDQMDPMNLADFFKSEEVPQFVWIQYANLRRPNRCDAGRPVSIIAIQPRKE